MSLMKKRIAAILLCLLLSRTDPARAERLAAWGSAAARGLLWVS